jgi:hypothetical protein
MIDFILLIGALVLFIISFVLLMRDLLSKNRLQNQSSEGKLTKYSGYSIGASLLALILMVFVSFGYIYR